MEVEEAATLILKNCLWELIPSTQIGVDSVFSWL